MFTLAEIDELHARLGRAESLADYVQGLASIGVARFDSFVADGHSEYVDSAECCVVSPPHHEVFDVAETADRDACLRHLARHSDGETSYVEMSRGLAESGVERWVVDTGAMTMSYLDRAGEPVLVEPIG